MGDLAGAIRMGTSHFVSLKDAVQYYTTYGSDPEDVEQMLQDKDIFIGPPKLGPGEKLSVDEDGRYVINY